jgi:DNA invertase Pin-like site-specific DNA recombinase
MRDHQLLKKIALLCSFNSIIHLNVLIIQHEIRASAIFRRTLEALQQKKKKKKLKIPYPSRVRKIHMSNAKEMYKKGQPEPKGEQAEERTASQVNSLVSMTMAEKMDESETNEWRRNQV